MGAPDGSGRGRDDSVPGARSTKPKATGRARGGFCRAFPLQGMGAQRAGVARGRTVPEVGWKDGRGTIGRGRVE